MTQRKPEGMSQQSCGPGRQRRAGGIDEQVEAARRRGEFDNLPGAGKPIAGVEKTDPDWWLKAFAAREGVNLASPLLEVRREVERFVES